MHYPAPGVTALKGHHQLTVFVAVKVNAEIDYLFDVLRSLVYKRLDRIRVILIASRNKSIPKVKIKAVVLVLKHCGNAALRK